MKKLLKTTITLAAIGVAVKVIKRKNNDNELIITDDYITSKKPFEFAQFKDRRVIKSEINKKWRTDCIIIDGYPHFLGK